MSKYRYPNGYSLLQAILRSYKLLGDPIRVMSDSVKKFGPNYTVRSGINSRFVLTQDPELIEYVLKKNHRNYQKSPIAAENLARYLGKGLLTSNGEYWLRQRRLIQPGFHMKKIEALYKIVDKTVQSYLDEFPTGTAIDIYPLMNTLAFKIVVNSLFDISLADSTMTELGNIISENQEFIIRDIRQPYTSWFRKLTGQEAYHLKKSKRGKEIIREIVRSRVESKERRDDLLDMLLDARYEDTGEAMSEEQIIDEILILIIAGHETTANALAWTLYLLGTHPDELRELRAVTAGLNTMECVSNELILSAIQESMRLYPPAWVTDRIALEDDRFNDYIFEKGTVIAMFFYGLHRAPGTWNAPDEYRMKRFLKHEVTKDLLRAYYPFGAGPRLCIGSHFAMAEMAIFIQKFIQTFDFVNAGHIPKLTPLITLRPDKVLLNINRK